jgi:hypothetical protein
MHKLVIDPTQTCFRSLDQFLRTSDTGYELNFVIFSKHVCEYQNRVHSEPLEPVTDLKPDFLDGLCGRVPGPCKCVRHRRGAPASVTGSDDRASWGRGGAAYDARDDSPGFRPPPVLRPLVRSGFTEAGIRWTGAGNNVKALIVRFFVQLFVSISRFTLW